MPLGGALGALGPLPCSKVGSRQPCPRLFRASEEEPGPSQCLAHTWGPGPKLLSWPCCLWLPSCPLLGCGAHPPGSACSWKPPLRGSGLGTASSAARRPACPEPVQVFLDCPPPTVGGGRDCLGCPARPLGSTFACLHAQKVGSQGRKLLGDSVAGSSRLFSPGPWARSRSSSGQPVLLLGFGFLFGK